MSRFNKKGCWLREKTLAMTVYLCVLLFATGCGLTSDDGSGNPSEAPTDSPAAAVINSPVTIPYLAKNPLEEVREEKNEGQNYIRTMTLSGLSDLELQTSINQQLTQLYEKTLQGGIPPYRGIRQMIPDSDTQEPTTPTAVSLDAVLSYNYNNVISVQVYSNQTYMDKTTYGFNVGTLEALNLDLNTGEELQLADVFTDDADYVTLLSDYISRKLLKGGAFDEEDSYIDMMSGGLKLVAPFKGIQEDQKFFLYQGGLGLILDYDTPEFDTRYSANAIYIPFHELGEVIAITQRFYPSEGDLYVSEKAPVYEFLQAYGADSTREQLMEEVDGIQVFQTVNYPKDIIAPAMDQVNAFRQKKPEYLEELAALSEGSGEGIPSMEQNIYASKTGGYTTVSQNVVLFYQNHWYNRNDYVCFDKKGNQMTVEDLFVSGFDYQEKILEGLEKMLRQNSAMTLQDPAQLVEGIQFTIGLSEISFTTAPVRMEDGSVYPFNFFLTYEEIGCDNLTLFE